MNPKKAPLFQDVETLRDPHEILPHWEVRREFILLNQDKFDDLDRIVCLSKCFVNIELLGCTYNEDVTKLVKELGSRVKVLEQRKFEAEESPKRKQTGSWRQESGGYSANNNQFTGTFYQNRDWTSNNQGRGGSGVNNQGRGGSGHWYRGRGGQLNQGRGRGGGWNQGRGGRNNDYRR